MKLTVLRTGCQRGVRLKIALVERRHWPKRTAGYYLVRQQSSLPQCGPSRMYGYKFRPVMQGQLAAQYDNETAFQRWRAVFCCKMPNMLYWKGGTFL